MLGGNLLHETHGSYNKGRYNEFHESFTRVSRAQFQNGAYFIILTPWREPGHKEGLVISNKYVFFRILTPWREPGHNEGRLISKQFVF